MCLVMGEMEWLVEKGEEIGPNEMNYPHVLD